VELKLAPGLNGRIRQISWHGKELLHVPTGAKDDPSNSSGAYENLSPGSRIYEIVGEPTPASATVSADLGVANWGSSTKQIAAKTVEIDTDAVVRITGTVTALDRNQKRQTATTVTEYRNDDGNATVRCRSNDGNWVSVPALEQKPDPKETKPNLAAAAEFVIRLPAQGIVVTEKYTNVAPQNGYLWSDAKRKVLVLEVKLAPVDVTTNKAATYMTRELRVKPDQ